MKFETNVLHYKNRSIIFFPSKCNQLEWWAADGTFLSEISFHSFECDTYFECYKSWTSLNGRVHNISKFICIKRYFDGGLMRSNL